jgi:hypothetical protein
MKKRRRERQSSVAAPFPIRKEVKNIDASQYEYAQQVAVGWYKKRLSCKEIRQRV